jgi:glyceraldehyde-3-phosphate dehydrogenase/erythrose-4-phosphate dehydrogenase
MVIYCTRTHS